MHEQDFPSIAEISVQTERQEQKREKPSVRLETIYSRYCDLIERFPTSQDVGTFGS